MGEGVVVSESVGGWVSEWRRWWRRRSWSVWVGDVS